MREQRLASYGIAAPVPTGTVALEAAKDVLPVGGHSETTVMSTPVVRWTSSATAAISAARRERPRPELRDLRQPDGCAHGRGAYANGDAKRAMRRRVRASAIRR